MANWRPRFGVAVLILAACAASGAVARSPMPRMHEVIEGRADR